MGTKQKKVESVEFSIYELVQDFSDATNGKIVYTAHVSGDVDGKIHDMELDVNYRPNIDFQMNNKQVPVDYIKLHVESQIRHYLELKEIAVPNVSVKFDFDQGIL